MNSFVSSASSAACAAPVRTSVSGGQDLARSASTSCCGDTPGFAATRDLVELAVLVEQPLGRRRSKPASVAPPIVADRSRT